MSAGSSDDDSSTGGAGAARVELLVVLAGSLALPLAALAIIIGLDATGTVGELGDDGDTMGGSADVEATGVSVVP